MDGSNGAAVQSDQWLDLEECAAYLKMTPRWVRRQVAEDDTFPVTRMGRLLRFKKSALDEWAAKRTTQGR
jgi:excisionase family DNA binding protein